MDNYICLTCGTQFPASETPPEECPICLDERQYIGHNGQLWTTMDELKSKHKNSFKEEEPNLTAIVSEPQFAIGQRALLVQSPDGNILWDCITLLDDDTITRINALGGIDKIAISHPHYYTSMIEWSRAFDAPIYIHEEERQYVVRPDDAIHFWQGETLPLGEGLTLIRCGGHYKGSQALHWADTADGKGALLTGDTIFVVADRRYVTFMYSYPNYIPQSPSMVRGIINAIEPFDFDRVYSFRIGLDIKSDAKAGVKYSADRYIRAISD